MKETRGAQGAIFSPPDVRDYTGVACVASPAAYPEAFALAMPSVKNQGAVGSCVAHAIATTIEYFSRTQGDDTRDMSVGYIYGNRANTTHTDTGMITRDAIAAACDCGTCVHTLFPYHEEVPGIIHRFEDAFAALHPKAYPNRFTSYYRLRDDAAIKASLVQNGPVIFAMEWYDDIRVENGVMRTDCVPSKSKSGHCLVLYGWEARGWKIQNSWGTGWGDGGRAVMPYDVPIREAWGIVDTHSEAQRAARMAELEAKNVALLAQTDELRAEIAALTVKLDEMGTIQELDAAQRAEIERLAASLDAANAALDAANREREAQQKELALLREELVEVKRPYDTKIGRLWAKICNAILNAFYWIFDRLRR